MAEFQKKQNKNKLIYSPLMLFGLLVIVLIFMYNMIELVEKSRETAKKRDLMIKNIESLQARENAIKNEIANLETEKGAEEAVREKYRVVKEGEKMVVIVDQEANAESAVSTVAHKKGLLEFVKNLFN